MVNRLPPRISPLSGELASRERERAYRVEHRPQAVRHLWFVAVSGAVFYLAGGAVDAMLVASAPTLRVLLAIRVLVAFVVLAAAAVATRRGASVVTFDVSVVASLIVVSAATCAIIALSPGEIILHALTVLVILLVFYTYVPARTLHALAAGLGFSAAFVAVCVLYLQPRANELTLVLLYLGLVNVLGADAARRQHAARRREHGLLAAERSARTLLQNEVEARATAEAALAESEERYRGLVELSPDPIVVHRGGEVLYANRRALELLGVDGDSLVASRSVFDFIEPEYHDVTIKRLNQLAAGEQQVGVHEIRIRCPDGRLVWCDVVSGRAAFEGRPAVQSVVRDIEERKRIEAELVRLATTDPLTGAFNRRHFFEHLEVEWARARRHRRPLALLILDIDHFKTVNDRFGHAAGDAVLRELVTTIRELLRVEDIVSRLGGEEFAFILPEIDALGATGAAQRIRRLVSAHRFDLPGREQVRLTVSIGAAACRLDEETPKEALQRADAALYGAKQAGRNRVQIG